MEDSRSSRHIVQFGVFELDPDAGELRKNGAKIRLQDQPFQVLQILLKQPGKVIPREELQQRIWPSDTFVDFDHGINNAIKRLREALGDTAETPRYIETFPRRGYRFVGKIENEGARFRSLAVLPLENLSHNPEQEYFAEGLTEALITTLAKIGELRVVSRTSAMLYRGAHKSVREIGQELQVAVGAANLHFFGRGVAKVAVEATTTAGAGGPKRMAHVQFTSKPRRASVRAKDGDPG